MEFEDPQEARRLTFWIIGGIVLILIIVGVIVHRDNKSTQAAQEKATQLQNAFVQAGLTAPSTDRIVALMGEDGGAVCESPAAALNIAMRDTLSSNGAAGPGMRPVYTSRQLVTGVELALGVYCPEELPEFRVYVNRLEFADTIKE